MDMQPLCSATLVALAHRCLEEPPSRALDAEIYCALHGIADANDLATPSLVAARQAGEVLVVEGGQPDWIEAPPFTGDLKYAALLLPDGIHALSKDPPMVCATGLSVLAMTAGPTRSPFAASVDAGQDGRAREGRPLEILSTP